MARSRPVTESLQEYARGIGGGLLFSLPLLVTMEVWAIGLSASPLRLGAFAGGTFALLVAYNHVAGIHAGHRVRDVLFESVEEMGLGLAVAAGLLALLGRFPDGLFSAEALGLLTVEGMVAAVGVSVGTAQLGQTPGGDADDEAGREAGRVPQSAGGEVVVALCGAFLIAANVAPTEEVRMLGVEMSLPALAGLAALSVVVGGALLYASAFRGSDRFAGSALGPVRGTVVTYAVALVASALMLWVFGQVETVGLAASVGPLVVLGFPAMLGASAGRLLLGSS